MKGLRGSCGARRALLLATASLFPVPADFAQGAEPEPAILHANTLAAFDRYVKLTETRNSEELERGKDLLWTDELPVLERTEAYAALKRGEVKMKKLEMLDGARPIPCPGGMIHHWTGMVFIPGAKLDDVLSILNDYDKHWLYFGPDVERTADPCRCNQDPELHLQPRWFSGNGHLSQRSDDHLHPGFGGQGAQGSG